jgi:hypothetical protein
MAGFCLIYDISGSSLAGGRLRLSGDTAQNGINREDEPAAGTMIAKTFFLA